MLLGVYLFKESLYLEKVRQVEGSPASEMGLSGITHSIEEVWKSPGWVSKVVDRGLECYAHSSYSSQFLFRHLGCRASVCIRVQGKGKRRAIYGPTK